MKILSYRFDERPISKTIRGSFRHVVSVVFGDVSWLTGPAVPLNLADR
jgi:hypothetical protein